MWGATVLVGLFGLGTILRWASFRFESEFMASLAAMLLFAPAAIITVCLGWTVQPSWRLVVKSLVGILIYFLACNAIMLASLPISEYQPALHANIIHWAIILWLRNAGSLRTQASSCGSRWPRSFAGIRPFLPGNHPSK
jgi:hypothetical protein